MGQAKQRGSFELRKAEAVEREKLAAAKREEDHLARRRALRLQRHTAAGRGRGAMMFLTLAAGIVLSQAASTEPEQKA